MMSANSQVAMFVFFLSEYRNSLINPEEMSPHGQVIPNLFGLINKNHVIVT